MSYADGIGSLQHALGSITPAPAKSPTVVSTPADQMNEGSFSAPTSARVDQMSLSSTGGIIARAMEGSDTRSAKVAALQQAIASEAIVFQPRKWRAK
jgi:negative regulator of flagellin synthesis FlgM